MNYDACVTTALTIKSKVGSIEKAAYMMTCGQKVSPQGAMEASAREQIFSVLEIPETFPVK